ncbi:hypothetical protein V5E97_05425 [Singulisphaera sp. Ch08]|uniref:Cytochrome c domain-containing protein n=1 Tax=Singulisphaera sp. Ch08 TaxID=3120278 RepID=A0AAU7CJY4_9BACT
MSQRWNDRRGAGSALVALLAMALGAGPAEDFYPVGHRAEGLPDPARGVRAYAADPASPLNELFRLIFVGDRIPKEVGAALPGERAVEGTDDTAFFDKAWYFRKRPGVETDRATFGGDVRISPVEELTPQQSERLIALLGLLENAEKLDAFPELRPAVARLMLQWDLLNVWSRFEKSGKVGPEVLVPLAKAVAACGQPADVLSTLPDGLADLHALFPGGKPSDRHAPYLPANLLTNDPASPWVEVDRKSSTLFHGASTFRSARLFLNAGSVEKGRALVEASRKVGKEVPLPEVQVGTEAALVLAIVGLTPDLVPVATPVVDELRVRTLATAEGTEPGKDTSSRDGINFWTYFRRRPAAAADPDHAAFRFVPDSAQSLFLEYGTAKRTTFAAQCVLCHRTTNAGGQAPAGLRSLSRYANPRIVTRPDARFRQAEAEIVPAVDKLKARLGSPRS